MKKYFWLLLPTLALFVLPSPVLAKRLLPRLQQATSTGTKVTAKTKGVSTLVRFRSDHRAIIVTFQNLTIASSVSYTLSYNTRGTTQGAGGTITTTADNQTRELLFGTCSHGVCRYDTGITNAKFTVTTTLPNGQKIVKSFKLKV